MKRNLSFGILVLAAIFTLQSFDIPPIRNFFKPKTCCGREVCLCRHAKGALCPFRAHEAALRVKKAAAAPQSMLSGHKSCHLHKSLSSVPVSQAAKQTEKEMGLTKAPCHRDAPPSSVQGFSKDFLLTPSEFLSSFTPQGFISNPIAPFSPITRQEGVDHPPKTFLLPVYF